MQIEVVTGKEMQAIPQPDGINWPDDSLHVISRAEDGSLQARMSLVAIPHIEGTWLSPHLRGTNAVPMLLEQMEEEVRNLGRTHLFAFASQNNEIVKKRLTEGGYVKQPIDVYVKEIQRCQ